MRSGESRTGLCVCERRRGLSCIQPQLSTSCILLWESFPQVQAEPWRGERSCCPCTRRLGSVKRRHSAFI